MSTKPIDAAELLRRASVLYRESRNATNPELARLLMLRSLRMSAQAGALEDAARSGVDADVAEAA